MSDEVPGRDCLMEDLLKEAEGYLDSDTEKALTLYMQAVEESPEDFRGYVGLARCYSRSNQPDRAVENAEKALELNPEAAKAYHVLTHVFLTRKENSRALSYAQKAYLLDPDSYNSLVNYGFTNFETENYGRVSEFYEKALELRPEELGLRSGLVASYMQTRRWKMARAGAKTLCETKPSIFSWWLRIGCALHIKYKTLRDLTKVFGLFILAGFSFGGLLLISLWPKLIVILGILILIQIIFAIKTGKMKDKIVIAAVLIFYALTVLIFLWSNAASG